MKRRSFFSGFLQAAAAVAVASSMEVFGAAQSVKLPKKIVTHTSYWSSLLTHVQSSPMDPFLYKSPYLLP